MTSPAPAEKASTPQGTVGKGRPTPKRSEARGRRTGPVVPPPQTRKEAAQRAKEEAKAARARVREGNQLLPRDAGPVRALVRDVVDRRRSVGVLMLPLALVLVTAQVASSAAKDTRLLDVAFVVWAAGVMALFVDLFLLRQQIRRAVKEQFPGEAPLRGHVAYGALRSTVLRRWRVPKARVSPGQDAPA